MSSKPPWEPPESAESRVTCTYDNGGGAVTSTIHSWYEPTPGSTGMRLYQQSPYHIGQEVWVRSRRTGKMCCGYIHHWHIKYSLVQEQITLDRRGSPYVTGIMNPGHEELVFEVEFADWGNMEKVNARDLYDHNVDDLAPTYEEMVERAAKRA